jgi:hypothetical protein
MENTVDIHIIPEPPVSFATPGYVPYCDYAPDSRESEYTFFDSRIAGQPDQSWTDTPWNRFILAKWKSGHKITDIKDMLRKEGVGDFSEQIVKVTVRRHQREQRQMISNHFSHSA